MEFEEIRERVDGVPFIGAQNAKYLYDLIVRERCTNILELGIAHGTATCYMAAAVRKLGGGKIVSVDLQGVDYDPSAEQQIESLGFGDIVEIHRMKTGYNWFLHDDIVKRTTADVCIPAYDLCIIDGPKNWTIDSSSFFLADKLLKRDAWLIFDDYLWTYDRADSKRDATDGISHRDLSDDERRTPHIRDVFELLVKQHPDYGRFVLREDTDWAIAQKNMATEKTYAVSYANSLSTLVNRKIRKFAKRGSSPSRPTA